MIPKEYQIILKRKLEGIYPEVKTEWSSMKGERDVYSPRVDLAVGPFATDGRYVEEYDNLLGESRPFIESLIAKHNENLTAFNPEPEDSYFEQLLSFNGNARCLLCIEIENETSRKHIIGGLVNASALGRVGILIPWTPQQLKAFLKLRNYLKFLRKAGKNTFKTDNVLILTKDQLDDCLRRL